MHSFGQKSRCQSTECASKIQFTVSTQALSRDHNPFLRLAKMVLSLYRASACVFGVPRFEAIRSAFSDKVGEHLRPAYQKKGYEGETV
jgi:hypothetical protein